MTKRIPTDGHGNARELPKPLKSKPKPYIEAEWIGDYRKQRDMSMLNDPRISEQTKNEIKEKYGI